MKAITLKQPWATLIAIGAKKIETRSWKTNYRGPIAIHSSKTTTPFDCAISSMYPYDEALGDWGTSKPFPCGAILAVAEIVDCVPTENISFEPFDWEEEFGDYSPGRFGWYLSDIVMLQKPIGARGSLGLWNLPAEIEDRMMEQVNVARPYQNQATIRATGVSNTRP